MDSPRDKIHIDPEQSPRAEHHGDQEPWHGMSAGQYLGTRFATLKPPMLSAPNPLKLVVMINRRQWAFFAVAFAAWVRCRTPRVRLS